MLQGPEDLLFFKVSILVWILSCPILVVYPNLSLAR